MKRICFYLLFPAGFILAGVIAGVNELCAQTIRIANNNPDATPGVNVYTGQNALQNAVDASVSGDIIYVTPSLTSYSSLQIVDKSLTIYGVGLRPDKDHAMLSKVGNVSINGTAASGTRISGLSAGIIRFATTINPTQDLSDITIDNCWVQMIEGGSTGNTYSNVLVRNCIFTGGAGAFKLSSSGPSDILFTNNIMKGTGPPTGSVWTGSGIVVQNNFVYYNGGGRLVDLLKHCTVMNNIFYGISLSLSGGTEYNTFRNNLFFEVSEQPPFPSHGTTDPDHNSFYDNIVGDPLPANFPGLTTFTWDPQWDVTPQPGSPVFGAGVDGVDIGPGGGPFPFDYEGTFLPLIQELIVPGVIEAGQDLQITIRAKGN